MSWLPERLLRTRTALKNSLYDITSILKRREHLLPAFLCAQAQESVKIQRKCLHFRAVCITIEKLIHMPFFRLREQSNTGRVPKTV